MGKTVVIVESPAKCNTIQKFLGKDYIVTASFGHIRDLKKGKDGVDKAGDFTPTYEIIPEKTKVVLELKKYKDQKCEFILATDDDREGTSIAWHLAEVLKLPLDKTKRIVFHEITEKAINEAIKHPTLVDINMVNSQQARRVLDRLVGFELSPLLWKKIKPELSAGRVQSVAVRVIVEREKEIDVFSSGSDFKILGVFNTTDVKGNDVILKTILDKRFKNKTSSEDLLNKCIGQQFLVKSIEVKPGKRSPSAPFTTSTLQQEASRKLGFSVERTMKVAQGLYEQGRISYMRTDSVTLSKDIITVIQNEVTNLYGKQYSNPQQYKNKSKSAQEAHEAIRPTHIEDQTIRGDSDQERLYELIWKRTVASQMSDAVIERTIISVSCNNFKELFVARGEILKFDGFLKLYSETQEADFDDGDETNESRSLPDLKEKQSLTYSEILAIETFTKPSARYTEASLVKKMEELGIGRPSTYASIISTIQKRGYAEKKDAPAKERSFSTLTLKQDNITEETRKEKFGSEKAKMFPTDTGIIVNDFLVKHFTDVLDYKFTAKVEEELDEIAEGKQVWNDVVGKFFRPLEQKVKEISKEERSEGRLLGVDPKTNKNIWARLGRFGPMIQLGDSGQDKATNPLKFAKLKEGQTIDKITLEEALDSLKWPITIGEYKKKDITAAIGKFGPYLKWNDAYYSVKTQALDTVTLKEAIVIIEEKLNNPAQKNGVIQEFTSKGIKVLTGKYGPYFTNGKKNYKIPTTIEPDKITLEECLDIIKKKR